LDDLIQYLPELLEETRGVVPRIIDGVVKNSVTLQSKGVSLHHLGLESKLMKLTDSLEADLEQLRDGNCRGIKEHLVSYREELSELNGQMEQEGLAYESLQATRATLDSFDEKAKENNNSAKELAKVMVARFGFEDLRADLEQIGVKLEELSARKTEIIDGINQAQSSSLESLNQLQSLQSEYNVYQGEQQEIQDKMDQARGDEARAKKQILKLQLIMNEMKVKIRKHRLPSISTAYESDLTQAYEYINSLEKLIEETPLNVQLLNATLKDAIDFIYKLYNNVNNVVGMAVMVENTIVFGNKYRSTYPDIDSELTRAELCFRNGEYTQALTIAIATIEKIHPGKYESLIKENAKSATA
ncbi:MAG: septation ring formation regulator EzrA, partial [Anaerorhabdus sp.]